MKIDKFSFKSFFQAFATAFGKIGRQIIEKLINLV